MAERRDGELTAVQAAFVLAYTSNGYNATRAYQAARPQASKEVAAVNGHRMLRVDKVARAIRQLQARRFKRWEMSGDEAAALTAISARADIRNAYDADGKPLPVHEWPEELRLALKGIKADGSFVLHDGLKARETILRMTGKLRDVVDVNHFDHLGYLAAIEQKRRAAQGATDGQAGPVEEAGQGSGEGRGHRKRR